jgi:hypothetical protein
MRRRRVAVISKRVQCLAGVSLDGLLESVVLPVLDLEPVGSLFRDQIWKGIETSDFAERTLRGCYSRQSRKPSRLGSPILRKSCVKLWGN